MQYCKVPAQVVQFTDKVLQGLQQEAEGHTVFRVVNLRGTFFVGPLILRYFLNLAAVYLPQMRKNVTSNIHFENPCGFKGSILLEVIYRGPRE